jgi:regulatory protein
MKITAIKQQVKQQGRYSVFVDDKYEFSLSETALLESKLASSQELTREQLEHYKKLSADDKVYNQALRYIAMRPRTEWEIITYLERKKASEEAIGSILKKLRKIELIDDEKFAKAFVADRRLLRPTSRRKLVNELRKKHVANDIIEAVLNGQTDREEINVLREIIAKKRTQTKFQDNLKLMQYLARQGFNYDDIKQALAEEN